MRMRCCRRFGKAFLRGGLGLGHLTEGWFDEPTRDDRLPAMPTGDAESHECEADHAERDQQHPPRATRPRFHDQRRGWRRDAVRVHLRKTLLRLPRSCPVRLGRSSARAPRTNGSRSGRRAPSMVSPRWVEPHPRRRARGRMRCRAPRCRRGSLRNTRFRRGRMPAPRGGARRTGLTRRHRRSRRLHL
jgi:hypothetical protein